MQTRKILFIFSILFLGSIMYSCKKEEDKSFDLKANSWKVVKIKQPRSNSYSQTRNEYVLTFKNDTIYTVVLDVNQCSGRYEITSVGDINFEALGCTRVCCDSDFAKEVIQLFPEMSKYIERGNELVLEGNGEMVFVKN